MTPTMQGLDARGSLVGWLKGLESMYTADIKAIPDDKWTATFGGCTRPANVLTADAVSLLQWATEALKGNVIAEYGPQIDLLARTATSKEAAISTLNESVDELAKALAAASDEALNSVVMPPWQMPAPLFIIAHIAVSHLWYHDGQLNYIQCLLGDEKVHWMD